MRSRYGGIYGVCLTEDVIEDIEGSERRSSDQRRVYTW